MQWKYSIFQAEEHKQGLLWVTLMTHSDQRLLAHLFFFSSLTPSLIQPMSIVELLHAVCGRDRQVLTLSCSQSIGDRNLNNFDVI